MAALRVRYADPRVEVRRSPDATWLIAGRVATDAPSLGPAGEAALCRELADGTVVRIDHPDGVATRVEVWRGAPASYEVHYAVRPDGDVILTDHFRDAVALLPIADRQPSPAVTIDHFLFRHARGADTYSAAVRRVAHGEHVTIDLGSGIVHTTIVERLESRHDERPVEAYVRDVDDAMAATMAGLRDVPGVVTMFSGGTDSTLMQSYLGDAVPALHVVPESPDVEMGGRHVDAAAAALGITPERVVVPTEDFLGQLEESTEQRGVPPHFPQWVTLRRAYETAHATYLIGERAGSFSRNGSEIPYYARRFMHGPARLAQPLLRAAAVTGRPHRLRLLADQAPALSADPASPDGWGTRMPMSYGDRRWAERVFGTSAVRQRYADRLAYFQDHVALAPSSADPYVRHLEVGGWSEFFNENNSQFRAAAFAAGKAIVDPFTSRPMMDALLGIPPQHRYEDGKTSKYLIKRLLRERVPGYPPVGKAEIVLPFKRFWSPDGPLGRVWDRYEVPPFFTGRDRDRLVRQPSETSWNAVTWAVWQERVARNAALTPLPASFECTWTSGAARVDGRAGGANSVAAGPPAVTDR